MSDTTHCISIYIWWYMYTYMHRKTRVDMASLDAVHDDVIKWTHFPRYQTFVPEVTGDRWIPLKNARDAELWCFLWSAPQQTAEQTIETPVTWDASALIMMSLWWWWQPSLQPATSKLASRQLAFQCTYILLNFHWALAYGSDFKSNGAICLSVFGENRIWSWASLEQSSQQRRTGCPFNSPPPPPPPLDWTKWPPFCRRHNWNHCWLTWFTDIYMRRQGEMS